MHLIRLADKTVRLQVSDYNPTQLRVKNEAVNPSIKFGEIVMVMISIEICIV